MAIIFALGVAILQYRLWDIDTIINRALVYGGLSALLGALYLGLILGLENLGGRPIQCYVGPGGRSGDLMEELYSGPPFYQHGLF